MCRGSLRSARRFFRERIQPSSRWRMCAICAREARARFLAERFTCMTGTPRSSMPSMQAIPEKGVALLIVAALLLMFAIVWWVAVSEKSSTYDERVHALGSWLVLHRGDFRIDPKNPPLWQHWAALENGAEDLHIDLNSPGFARVLKDQEYRYPLTIDWL